MDVGHVVLAACLLTLASCQRDLNSKCAGFECPKYSVQETGEGFEVRRYDPAKWVAFTVTNDDPWWGMKKLFQYFNGENTQRVTMERTMPMLRKLEGNTTGPNYRETMMMMLPKEEQANPPTPTDSELTIVDMPAMTVYAADMEPVNSQWTGSWGPGWGGGWGPCWSRGWGPGSGRGWGMGPGRGWGMGPGMGGWGMGPGMGGWGMGPGMGGWGMGPGRGWGRGQGRGWGRGQGRGWGRGQGRGWGRGPGRGWGRGSAGGWGPGRGGGTGTGADWGPGQNSGNSNGNTVVFDRLRRNGERRSTTGPQFLETQVDAFKQRLGSRRVQANLKYLAMYGPQATSPTLELWLLPA